MKGTGLDNSLCHKEIGGFCISERSGAGDVKQKLLLWNKASLALRGNRLPPSPEPACPTRCGQSAGLLCQRKRASGSFWFSSSLFHYFLCKIWIKDRKSAICDTVSLGNMFEVFFYKARPGKCSWIVFISNCLNCCFTSNSCFLAMSS